MSILEDVRLAFRLFRRNFAGTAIALLSIALSVVAPTSPIYCWRVDSPGSGKSP